MNMKKNQVSRRKSKTNFWSEKLVASLTLGVLASFAITPSALAWENEKPESPVFHLIKVVCPSYSVVTGNGDADKFDATGGHFTEFANYSTSTPHFTTPYPFKPVDPWEIPQECVRTPNWRFLFSTNAAQTQNPALTDPTNSIGEVSFTLSDLWPPVAYQFKIGNKIWISEVMQSGSNFAAIRCSGDALNGDNLEWIQYAPDSWPRDIFCVAYNVKEEVRPKGSISGIKFNDLNGDGIKDVSEPVLNGWTINLTGSTTASTVTNALGKYTFNNLSAGTYQVCEAQQSEWNQTLPSSGYSCPGGTKGYSLDLTEGQIVTGKDFGNKKPTGTITISKLSISGNNGSTSDTFNFTGDLGNFGITTTAHPGIYADGSQTFTVPAGSYDVTELNIPGWKFYFNECNDPSNDSSLNGQTVHIKLAVGENVSCRFVNKIHPLGTIIIQKQTLNYLPDKTGAVFNFGGDLGNFSIDMTGGQYLVAKEFHNLPAGSYNVYENIIPHWELYDISCIDNTGDTVLVNPTTVKINLADAPDAVETVICTFSNRKY